MSVSEEEEEESEESEESEEDVEEEVPPLPSSSLPLALSLLPYSASVQLSANAGGRGTGRDVEEKWEEARVGVHRGGRLGGWIPRKRE